MAKKMSRKSEKSIINEKLRSGELSPADISQPIGSNVYKPTAASRLNKDRVTFGTQGRPSAAQLALIERYKVESNKQIVNNTIDQIVSEKIYEIKEAIDNMINYGDVSVFKVLPKELDEKMRVYGMFAQEYFGKKISKTDGMQVFIVPTSFIYCPKCKSYKSQDDFFLSKSDIYSGHSCICKDCAVEMFIKYYKKYKDIRECLILISYKLDMLVYEPVLNQYVEYYNTTQGKKDFLSGAFLGKYICDLWVSIKVNEIPEEECSFSFSNLGGVPFKCINRTMFMPEIYDDKIVSDKEYEEDKEDKGISKLRKRWGNYERDELNWLESQRSDWYDAYDINDKSLELLVEQLCLESLLMRKDREKGVDTSKRLRNIQDMMKTGGLTDRKKKNNNNNTFTSLGEFIEHVEKTKPIIHKDPQFEDVDGIKRIWRSIVGALCRTAGIKSDYIDEFENNYSEYTVDFMDEQNNSSNNDQPSAKNNLDNENISGDNDGSKI